MFPIDVVIRVTLVLVCSKLLAPWNFRNCTFSRFRRSWQILDRFSHPDSHTVIRFDCRADPRNRYIARTGLDFAPFLRAAERQ